MTSAAPASVTGLAGNSRSRWRLLAESDEARELVAGFVRAQREARAASAALERLVALCQPIAEGIARGYAKSEADAADMVQEALVYLTFHLVDLREPAAFPYWFARVAHTACRQWLRRERLRRAESVDRLGEGSGALAEVLATMGGDQDSADERLATQDAVVRLLRILPARESEVVRRVYLDEQPQLAAGRRMGLSRKAVESLLYRALRRLRLVAQQCNDDYETLTLWCTKCGAHQLIARLQVGDSARYPFRIRATCPGCNAREPFPHWAYIGLEAEHYPSLESALLHGMGELATDIQQLVRAPRCAGCQQTMSPRHGADLLGYLYWECHRCRVSTSAGVELIPTVSPQWRAFWRSTPRMRHTATRKMEGRDGLQIVVSAWDPATGRTAMAALDSATLALRSVQTPPAEPRR